MRYYFGENGWPASKLGVPPEAEADRAALIDSLQVLHHPRHSLTSCSLGRLTRARMV